MLRLAKTVRDIKLSKSKKENGKGNCKGRRRYIYQWIQVKLRLQRCKESLVGERNILL